MKANVALGYGIIKNSYRIGPQYNRKHTLTPSASVVSANGMSIEGIDFGSTLGDLHSVQDIPSGEAKWEAGSQSGLAPFYDTYDNYIQGLRQKGKDYSIIPEFRIRDHVEEYLETLTFHTVYDSSRIPGIGDYNIVSIAQDEEKCNPYFVVAISLNGSRLASALTEYIRF